MAAFRCAPWCTGVVETLVPSSVADAPQRILNQTPHYASLYHAFRNNDRCGSPRTFDFGGDVGVLAPTTLRYIKILSDLEAWFKNLDSKRVVEIGGGYGGQCAVIKTRFKVSSYTLIDLPPVLSLAKAYLDHVGIDGVSYLPWEDLAPLECDLVISNYALSEMTREVQQFYLDRVISKAPRGYFLWNAIGAPIGSVGVEEFARCVPSASAPPLLMDDIGCNVRLLAWARSASDAAG